MEVKEMIVRIPEPFYDGHCNFDCPLFNDCKLKLKTEHNRPGISCVWYKKENK